jgi:TetR/AcrR family acrAB operon transcriptional repressor
MYVYLYPKINGIKMRRTKEEAEQTRKQIISSAISVMNSRGIGQTRYEDIAKEANVTRGAIYHYFKSKNDILYAIHESSKQKLIEIFDKHLSEDTDPVLSLKNGFTEVFKKFEDDAEYRSIEMLFLKAEFNTLIRENKELNELFYKERKETIEKLRLLVKRGQDLGSIRKDIDPVNIVEALVSIYIGFITTWFLQFTQFSIKETANDYIDILLHGILR